MRILVANIGSTSFKHRLYERDGEKVLAEGRAERIGQPGGPCPDYETAVSACLREIAGPGKPLASLDDLAAVGFKTVHARGMSGCRIVDEDLFRAMEDYAMLLPAHNPPYVKAMRAFGKAAPRVARVALFETAFFQEMAPAVTTYAVPFAWEEEDGFRRHGFHGASHRWASERVLALSGRKNLRHVSCHLGGSSSLAAVRDGTAVNTSFGMTPQCGLAQGRRCGDVDVFAVLHVMKRRGLGVDEVAGILGTKSGLLGISGVSGDVRDLQEAAAKGNPRARRALDVFVHDVRRYLGQFWVQLGGLDAITFSGGIGEKSPEVRAGVLAGLEEMGVRLDPERNRATDREAEISADGSRVRVWVVKTNEELIVARAAREAVGAMRRN